MTIATLDVIGNVLSNGEYALTFCVRTNTSTSADTQQTFDFMFDVRRKVRRVHQCGKGTTGDELENQDSFHVKGKEIEEYKLGECT